MGDVLVVDDDPGVRDFIGFALGAEGIPYRTAEHGARALACVAAARPRVILLDLDMPVMDGRRFCAALDATLGRAGTAIVAMSASGRVRQFQAACGADAALGKPFDLDELYAAVADARRRPTPEEPA